MFNVRFGNVFGVSILGAGVFAGGARGAELRPVRGCGGAGGGAAGGRRRPGRDGRRGPHSAQPQRAAPRRRGDAHAAAAQQRRQRVAGRRRRRHRHRPLALHVAAARADPATPLRELRPHPADAGRRDGRAPPPDEGPRPQGHVQVS